jgi:hypothetical protein
MQKDRHYWIYSTFLCRAICRTILTSGTLVTHFCKSLLSAAPTLSSLCLVLPTFASRRWEKAVTRSSLIYLLQMCFVGAHHLSKALREFRPLGWHIIFRKLWSQSLHVGLVSRYVKLQFRLEWSCQFFTVRNHNSSLSLTQ